MGLNLLIAMYTNIPSVDRAPEVSSDYVIIEIRVSYRNTNNNKINLFICNNNTKQL